MEGLFRNFRRGFYGGGRPGGEEMCKYKIAREMCKYNTAREEMCKYNTAREERNSRLRKVDGVGSGQNYISTSMSKLSSMFYNEKGGAIPQRESGRLS